MSWTDILFIYLYDPDEAPRIEAVAEVKAKALEAKVLGEVVDLEPVTRNPPEARASEAEVDSVGLRLCCLSIFCW